MYARTFDKPANYVRCFHNIAFVNKKKTEIRYLREEYSW